MRAVCVHCGGSRSRYEQICPSCGARPSGEGLLIAWLLSSESLTDAELDDVATRVKAGENIRPSARMLEKARRATGAHLASDPGMTLQQRLGLLVVNLVFTPLVGWTLWFFWREQRPRAALEALALSLPATALFTVLVPLAGIGLRVWGVDA